MGVIKVGVEETRRLFIMESGIPHAQQMNELVKGKRKNVCTRAR